MDREHDDAARRGVRAPREARRRHCVRIDHAARIGAEASRDEDGPRLAVHANGEIGRLEIGDRVAVGVLYGRVDRESVSRPLQETIQTGWLLSRWTLRARHRRRGEDADGPENDDQTQRTSLHGAPPGWRARQCSIKKPS